MKNYLVTAVNSDYNGKLYGVMFNKGKAILNDAIVDPLLGLTADEVATRLREDFHCEVVELNAEKRVDEKRAVKAA